MDIQTLLPVISKILGRDISVELNLFYRARSAIGSSMNEQGQRFFIENWPKAVDFMESPEGKAAIVDFMNAWVKSCLPKTIAKDPEPIPVNTKEIVIT